MDVTELCPGHWAIEAPWLDEPVYGDTFHEAYGKALKARWERHPERA